MAIFLLQYYNKLKYIMFLKLLFYFESLEKQDFINIINKVILNN